MQFSPSLALRAAAIAIALRCALPAWADANPGAFGEHDLRADRDQYIQSIREYLRQHQGTRKL